MKIIRRILWIACVFSGVGAFRHLGMALKIRLELASIHDLGLDTAEYMAIVQATVRQNLIEGVWFLLVTLLVALAIRRLRKIN